MTSVALESIIAIDGQRRLRRLGAACVVLLVCTLALFVTGFFDAQRFIEGAPAIQQLASEMVPPNFERWEHWVIPLRDTLAMSIAGTALTVLASLPLALVAAPNTAPNAVVGRIVRTILAAFRSVPEIILGILFVAAVGFGALPGVLALALHSTGMVAKFAVDSVKRDNMLRGLDDVGVTLAGSEAKIREYEERRKRETPNHCSRNGRMPSTVVQCFPGIVRRHANGLWRGSMGPPLVPA